MEKTCGGMGFGIENCCGRLKKIIEEKKNIILNEIRSLKLGLNLYKEMIYLQRKKRKKL